jgi:molybdopterin molybdotransferase
VTTTRTAAPVVAEAGATEAGHGTSWNGARAVADALGSSRATATTSMHLAEAVGLVLRESVRARVALPPHSASAMDGWAVAGEPPWTVTSPIDAGHAPDHIPLAPGTARPICTGAPVPAGTLGVLRLENGEENILDNRRELDRAPHARADEPRPGEHVRHAGEEAREGELLISRGSVLTPPRIALAAASGHDLLRVANPPTVDILVLGDELSASGLPPAGSIRDVVTPSFPALIAALGGRVQQLDRCRDNRADTVTAMASGSAEMLIVTGGSSRGRTDHARAAARALGIRFEVDGVAMRPGHPVAFGSALDGRIVLLLPGNPFAAFAALLSFGAPMLAAMLRRTPVHARGVRLAESVTPHHRDTRLVAVAIQDDGARPLDLQSSGMLRGLAAADGLAVVQPGSGATGETVPLLPLPW